jgi:MoaA/NifB/PqqE/SkfB family radical SAM enzyme
MKDKSDVKKLYEKYGDKICLAPFLNNFYISGGVVNKGQTYTNQLKPCSVIKDARGEERYSWKIKNSSIFETRNSPEWIELRRAFLDGKFHDIEECRSCSQAEKLEASSSRKLNNEYLFEHLEIDIIAEMEKIVANGLVADTIHALDYMPSNYCNYACVMCAGGASSQRLIFEIKNGSTQRYVQNQVDSDFFERVRDVKILGFTGGETILQPEVIKLIDYLIEEDLAKNIIITILTNASSFPDNLIAKFEKFKRVLYTISIDGIGDVIEYQRRGSKWSDVSANAIKINECPTTHNIVNYVATCINLLSAMDFVDWCHSNNLKFISISPVYQQKLSLSAMPPELAKLALDRLKEGRKRYEHYLDPEYDNFQQNYVFTIDRLIGTIENAVFNPEALDHFIEHIKREDVVSKKPLREVVTEWAPWFV